MMKHSTVHTTRGGLNADEISQDMAELSRLDWLQTRLIVANCLIENGEQERGQKMADEIQAEIAELLQPQEMLEVDYSLNTRKVMSR